MLALKLNQLMWEHKISINMSVDIYKTLAIYYEEQGTGRIYCFAISSYRLSLIPDDEFIKLLENHINIFLQK